MESWKISIDQTIAKGADPYLDSEHGFQSFIDVCIRTINQRQHNTSDPESALIVKVSIPVDSSVEPRKITL